MSCNQNNNPENVSSIELVVLPANKKCQFKESINPLWPPRYPSTEVAMLTTRVATLTTGVAALTRAINNKSNRQYDRQYDSRYDSQYDKNTDSDDKSDSDDDDDYDNRSYSRPGKRFAKRPMKRPSKRPMKTPIKAPMKRQTKRFRKRSHRSDSDADEIIKKIFIVHSRHEHVNERRVPAFLIPLTDPSLIDQRQTILIDNIDDDSIDDQSDPIIFSPVQNMDGSTTDLDSIEMDIDSQEEETSKIRMRSDTILGMLRELNETTT